MNNGIELNGLGIHQGDFDEFHFLCSLLSGYLDGEKEYKYLLELPSYDINESRTEIIKSQMKYHSSEMDEYYSEYDKTKFKSISFCGYSNYIYPIEIDQFSDIEFLKKGLDLKLDILTSDINNIGIIINKIQYKDNQTELDCIYRKTTIFFLLDEDVIKKVRIHIEKNFNEVSKYSLQYGYEQLIEYINHLRDKGVNNNISLDQIKLLDLNSISNKKVLFLNLFSQSYISISNLWNNIISISVNDISDIRGKIGELYFDSGYLMFNSNRVIMKEGRQKNLLIQLIDSALGSIDLDKYMDREFGEKWINDEDKYFNSLKSILSNINNKLKDIKYPQSVSKDGNQVIFKLTN